MKIPLWFALCILAVAVIFLFYVMLNLGSTPSKSNCVDYIVFVPSPNHIAIAANGIPLANFRQMVACNNRIQNPPPLFLVNNT